MKQTPPFRKLGLLWDEPDLKDETFLEFIRGSDRYRRSWALARLLERAPLNVVCQLLSLNEIELALKETKMKPQMRKAWEHAIQYWHKTA